MVNSNFYILKRRAKFRTIQIPNAFRPSNFQLSIRRTFNRSKIGLSNLRLCTRLPTIRMQILRKLRIPKLVDLRIANLRHFETPKLANSPSNYQVSNSVQPTRIQISTRILENLGAYVSDERDSSNFQQPPCFCRRLREIIFARPRKSTVTLANRRADNIREQRAQPLSS